MHNLTENCMQVHHFPRSLPQAVLPVNFNRKLTFQGAWAEDSKIAVCGSDHDTIYVLDVVMQEVVQKLMANGKSAYLNNISYSSIYRANPDNCHCPAVHWSPFPYCWFNFRQFLCLCVDKAGRHRIWMIFETCAYRLASLPMLSVNLSLCIGRRLQTSGRGLWSEVSFCSCSWHS